MSRGLHRLRYREGACPEFGRVRPVHIGDFVSMESRQRTTNGEIFATLRLGWSRTTALPRTGEYVSVHQERGKFLAAVGKVAKSCVCCAERAMWFVYLLKVPNVLIQDGICECATGKAYVETMDWGTPPDHGLCRKVGSGSLLAISNAIKRKS